MRLKSLVPLALRIKGRTWAHHISAQALDISFWPERLSHRLRGAPLPSGNLIYLIAQHRRPDIFLRSGEVSAQQIRDTLKRNGDGLERFNAILDFGCGVGRVGS